MLAFIFVLQIVLFVLIVKATIRTKKNKDDFCYEEAEVASGINLIILSASLVLLIMHSYFFDEKTFLIVSTPTFIIGLFNVFLRSTYELKHRQKKELENVKK